MCSLHRHPMGVFMGSYLRMQSDKFKGRNKKGGRRMWSSKLELCKVGKSSTIHIISVFKFKPQPHSFYRLKPLIWQHFHFCVPQIGITPFPSEGFGENRVRLLTFVLPWMGANTSAVLCMHPETGPMKILYGRWKIMKQLRFQISSLWKVEENKVTSRC